jgi:protein TonB
MNYQIRAFQLSIILHAAAIVLLIVAGNHFVSKQNRLLVVDFTLSDSPQAYHGLSMVTGNKPQSGGDRTKITKQKHQIPITETAPPTSEKKEAETAKEAKQALPTPAQAPAVTDNEKLSPVNTKEKDNQGTSSKQENTGSLFSGGGAKRAAGTGSLPSGGGAKGTAGDGTGNSYGTGGTGYLKANFAYIRNMIVRRIIYPERAREMGWQGKVKVSFVISSDGSVKDIRILESSGVDLLDRNAVNTVEETSPFPKPPVAAQLIIPISYRLR